MRKLFKRWTPSTETIQNHPRLKFFLSNATHPRLWHLNRRGVALGAAIGAAVCVIPLPIQVLLAAAIALACKAHLPTAVAATFISNPFTAVMVWGSAWKIGSLITGHVATDMLGPSVSWSDMNGEHLMAALGWLQANGQPLLIGIPVVGLGLGLLSYLIVMVGWRVAVCWQWQRRAN